MLVVRDGKVVLDRGYGLANREKEIPVTKDTIFAVGSTPIDFTRAAILLLVEEEQMGLDEPITSYFDDVPEDKLGVTVEYLMSGQSGLLDFHDVPTDRDPDHAWIDRDEAVRRILASELLFVPGSRREHSHSAWGLLAAIVEIVSDQSYQEFTRERLFDPAGMQDTGFNGDGSTISKRSSSPSTRGAGPSIRGARCRQSSRGIQAKCSGVSRQPDKRRCPRPATASAGGRRTPSPLPLSMNRSQAG